MRRHLRVLVAALAAACGSDGTGPTPPPAPVPTQVSLATQPSATVQNGVALNTQPVVRLRDAAGVPAPVAGVVVTASLASGAGVVLANAAATTNASGIASFTSLTLTGTVGSYTLRFSAPNLTSVDANPVTVTAGVPSQLALAAQPSAAAQAGVALAAQPAVQLRDASGNDAGVAGVTVNATLVSGTLTLGNASAVTSASGTATFAGLTLSGTAGSYTLRFTSGSLAPVDAGQPTVLAAGAPAQLALTTAPGSGANGAPLTTQPVVQLRDAFGNDAAQAGVRIVAGIVTGPGGGTLAGDTSLTDANGRATFGALAITGLAGNYSLRFASTGFTSIVSVTPVILTAGAAARLGVTTQPPATAQSGVAMTAPPVVQVQDQSGNPVAQAGVAVTASLAAGTATLTNVTASTDATGKATFTGLTVTGQVNVYLLQFTSTGLASINAGQVLTLQPGPAAALSLTTAPSAAVVNGAPFAVQPVVQLRDAQGNASATGGVIITASVVSGTVVLANATATSTASGTATFSGLSLTGTAGSYTLRFSAPSVTSVDANPVTVTAGVPSLLALAAQPSAAAQAGVALAAQPAVQLRDASGNDAGVAGVTVNAALVSGTLTLGNASAVTSASGLASFAGLTLSGTAGSYTLRFTSGSLAPVDAGQPTVLAAGVAAQLALTTEPGTGAANGTPLATQPVVQLRDAFGNDAVQAGVQITASIVAGPSGATLAGATSLTDASGRATFGALAITGLAGSYSLAFASAGFTSVMAVSPVVIAAGAAAQLGLTTQPPSTAQSGVAMTAPVVQVQDQSGNAVAQAGVAITASLASGTATLTNVSASTDATGKATFTGLTLTGQVNPYLLRFTSPGLTSIDAGQVLTLEAGPAAALSLTTAPSAAAVNAAPLAVQPVVQLRDAQGNASPTGGVVITASVVSGTVVLANATATTAVSGAATFAGLSLTGAVGSYTLRFTAGAAGVGTIDAALATVLSPGPARRLTLTAEPSTSAVSGTAFGAQPVVQLRDTTGNLVSQAGVVVSASVIGGGPAVGGATATTNGAGVATFAGLMLSGTVGSYTLRFTSGGLVAVDAGQPTALAAGAPTQLVIITLPPATAVNGMPLGTAPVIEVQDASGNPVSGVSVGAATSGNVTIGNGVAVTGPAGRATFSGLTLTGQVAGYSLQFCLGSNCNTSGTVIGSPQPTQLSAGAPASVTLTTTPSVASQSGSVLARQPVAHVADVSGNVLANVTVTLTTGAGASIAGGSAVTDASGQATFSGVALSGTPAAYTLTFTAGSAATTAPLTLSPGAAATLTIDVAPPSAAQNGEPFAAPPSVTVRDATGNPVPGLTVDAILEPAGASIINATAATNGAGVATFTGMGLAGAAADYTIRFETGAAQATSGAVTLAAGTANTITITTAPSAAAQNGVALASQPVIHLQDGSANPIANRLVIASVVGGTAQLANAVATTDVNGDATFSGLTLTGPLGSKTLRFTAAGLSVDAAPTTLSSGVASKLVVVSGGGNQQNGVVFTPAPVLQVTDAGGNAVSTVTTVTASVVSGSGLLSGASVGTNASGTATFGALTVTGTAEPYVIAFDAAGLAGAQLAVTVLPGAATQLALATQPSQATTLSQLLPVQPVVQLQDQSGNAVSQAGVAVVAGSVSGAVTFTGTTSVPTDASGMAAFSDLAITAPQGRSVLRFTSGALVPAVAADTTVAAAPLASNTPIVQSGTLNTQTPFAITVPPGRDSLVVTITGNGGADLLLRYGTVPNINAGLWDCYPALGGSNETCTMLNPQAGTWYAILYAVFSYSNVTLTATIY